MRPTVARWIPLLTALTAISACQRGSGKASDTLDTVPAASQNLTPSIGGGWDTVARNFVGHNCMDVAPDNVEEVIDGQASSAKFTSDMKYGDIVEFLGGDATLTANIGPVTANGGVEYARLNAATSYTAATSIIVEVNGYSRRIKHPDLLGLTADGLTAASDLAKGRKICGDEYIQQIRYGSRFISTLRVEFANATDYERFKGHLKIDIASLGSVGGSLESITSQLSGKVKISFDATQLGGQGFKIPDALGNAMGLCSVSNPQGCQDAFKAAYEYAQKFGTQITTASGEVNFEQLAPLTYETVPYIQELYSQKVAPVVARAMRMDQTLLYSDLQILQEDFTRADAIMKSMTITDPNRRGEIKRIAEQTVERAKVLADALAVCSTVDGAAASPGVGGDTTACAQAVDKARSEVRKTKYDYNPSALIIAPGRFEEWCNLHAARAAKQAEGATLGEVEAILDRKTDSTVEAIIAFVNLPTGSICQDIGLEAETKITMPLIGGTIENLEPIMSLEFLEALNLNGTRVSKLDPVGSLVYLEDLDVSNTKILSLAGLRGSRRLKVLQANSKYLEDVAGLEKSTGLETLSIRGTRIESLEPLRGLPNLVSLDAGESKIKTIKNLIPSWPKLQFVTVKKAELTDPSECDASDKIICED